MKKSQIVGLLALSLLGSVASSQAQSTTAPVGYVTLASPSNPIPANTDIYLSVPMEASVDFTGLASSATGSTLTVTNAAFTTDQFAPATGGYYIRVKNGVSKGLTAEITANTADQLTLALEPGDDLTNVSSTTQFEIVKYFTLNTFFPPTLPPGVQIQFFSNTTAGINKSSSETIVWTGSAWFKPGVGIIDATMYPGEAFIFRNNTDTPVSDIVVTGIVPTVSARAVINSINGDQQDFTLSYLSPVPEQIGNSGLGFTAGDQLLSFDTNSGLNKSAAKTLVWTGSNWFEPGVGVVDTTFLLNPGVGYVYRKAAGNAGATEWNNVQNYNQ